MLCWICRLFWTRDEICFLQFTVKLLLISLFVLPSPCWYSNLSMASLKTTERRKWLTAQTDENVERETFSVNLSFLSWTLTVCRIAEVSEGTMFIPFHRSTVPPQFLIVFRVNMKLLLDEIDPHLRCLPRLFWMLIIIWLLMYNYNKWLWVRVRLQSLKLEISVLLRARGSLTCRQLKSVDSLLNAYVTWSEHTVSIMIILLILTDNLWIWTCIESCRIIRNALINQKSLPPQNLPMVVF